MYNNNLKKLILENLLLKQGKKWKSENLIKNTLKYLQKLEKKKSVNFVKNAIMLNADGLSENKQTLKKGKRKRILKTTVFLVSEKARFSYSWKNLIKSVSFRKNKAFFKKLAEQLQVLNSTNVYSTKLNIKTLIHQKYKYKFKW